MILAIDTSAGQCAVALVGDRIEISRREEMQRGHAEALFPMIDAALAEAGAAFSDLARIAVCTGPGSFTGLRIGVAAARGLGLGLGVPVVGISRFEALAGDDETIRLPGRGGQVYVQDFVDHAPRGLPRIEAGDAADRLADPAVIAHLAADRQVGARPAPLYVRGADADPPRDVPPALLD